MNNVISHQSSFARYSKKSVGSHPIDCPKAAVNAPSAPDIKVRKKK